MRILIVLMAGMNTAQAPEPTQTVIRVMTYNIHHAEGLDGAIDLDRIAAVIESERPDVVCLQEVDRNLARTHERDLPAELAARLGMAVAYGVHYRFGGGEYGNATLSRFELRGTENLPLPNPDGAEPRGCLKTGIVIDGRRVEIWNTHLGLDAGERLAQADAIARSPRESAPVVLAGDFNEGPGARGVEVLLSKFADTASGTDANESFTIPADHPTRRIDLILVSPELESICARSVRTPTTQVASDHLPMFAEVRLRPATSEPSAHRAFDHDDHRVFEAIRERP